MMNNIMGFFIWLKAGMLPATATLSAFQITYALYLVNACLKFLTNFIEDLLAAAFQHSLGKFFT